MGDAGSVQDGLLLVRRMQDQEMDKAAAVSVVICAYMMERWPSLRLGIAGAVAQIPAPAEVIVVADTDELVERVRAEWADGSSLVRPMRNSGVGINGARNTGLSEAKGEIVLFLDDDATPEPAWLQRMVDPFQDADVVAVGGAPVPVFAVPRPSWFPLEFDWVFGCRYLGLPKSRATVRHIIGTTMAMRREDLLAIGGFQSRKLEDLDISLRLARQWPDRRILYEPAATVDHLVPADRLTWGYFWRRCFSENRSKAEVLRKTGGAPSLAAEKDHAFRTIPLAGLANMRDVLRGDIAGLTRIGASVIGLGLAALGLAVGMVEQRRTESSR